MKEMYFIFDNQSNIINDNGHADFETAKENFVNYFETKENAEGFTLCLVTLDNKGCWIECLEEHTPDEIFEI